MLINLVFFASVIQGILGIIERLNESEYSRMPPVFHLQPYEQCVGRGGTYCSVRFRLITTNTGELGDMIREYSAHTVTHYDHTNLEYGVCLTKCMDHFKINITMDQDEILERCLNETLSRDYGLKAKITVPAVCHKSDDKIPLDAGDIVVAAVIMLLLLVNVVGSLYDFYVKEKKEGILTCFSVFQNWKRLMAPAGEGPEPRMTRLKCFYGIRTISMALVILSHSFIPFVFSTNNTHYIEESFYNPLILLMMNSTAIVQTFFIMSGFLLIFNLQLQAERHELSWTMVPRSVLLRWLRLTPVYAVVLAITATWLRFFGPGPLWQTIGEDAVAACRSKWWENLLYFNNYDDEPSQCMPHSWYIAADLQLHIVGLIVGVMTKGRVRKVVLLLLFVVGLVGPVAHTYYQDLDGVLIMKPEAVRVIFANDATFNHVYKRGHTNLACFVIGLALGLMIYHLQRKDFKIDKYFRYRYLYWAVVPLAVLQLYSGGALYRAPRAAASAHALLALTHKPLFGAAVAIIVLGMVFKYEKVYRGVVEWGGWGAPSRVSYCAYVVHLLFVRIIAGTRTSLVYTSFLHVIQKAIGTLVISFLVAVPLALLVEMPFNQVVKIATSSNKKLSSTKVLHDRVTVKNNNV